LNYNPLIEQPMIYQNHTDQLFHKEDERPEQEKLPAKEPELLEKYI